MIHFIEMTEVNTTQSPIGPVLLVLCCVSIGLTNSTKK